MRDVIWTLIVIWLVYRLVGLFKSPAGKNRDTTASAGSSNDTHHQHAQQDSSIKKAVQKHLNNEGEYVEFEEIRKENK
jgi:hypothetical protein